MLQHFLTLDDLSATDLADLLAVATYLKRRHHAGVPEHVLAGKTLAMIFEKPSLRTRLSFEVAMSELGGRSLYIRGEEVGMGAREPVRDVARVIGGYTEGIMARVFKHQTILDLAAHAGVPVINGLCDRAHPCQVLADLLTINEHLGTTSGLTITFVGDANNVCRTLARACVITGSRLILACPPGYGFSLVEQQRFGPAWGSIVTETNDLPAAVANAHVLYTDVWTSMGQEAEKERRMRDFQGFTIDERLLAMARPDARIMHCLPAHRGEEISDGAVEHPRSLIFDQAENRLHAQKAVLRLLLGPEPAAVIAAARG